MPKFLDFLRRGRSHRDAQGDIFFIGLPRFDEDPVHLGGARILPNEQHFRAGKTVQMIGRLSVKTFFRNLHRIAGTTRVSRCSKTPRISYNQCTQAENYLSKPTRPNCRTVRREDSYETMAWAIRRNLRFCSGNVPIGTQHHRVIAYGPGIKDRRPSSRNWGSITRRAAEFFSLQLSSDLNFLRACRRERSRAGRREAPSPGSSHFLPHR